LPRLAGQASPWPISRPLLIPPARNPKGVEQKKGPADPGQNRGESQRGHWLGRCPPRTVGPSEAGHQPDEEQRCQPLRSLLGPRVARGHERSKVPRLRDYRCRSPSAGQGREVACPSSLLQPQDKRTNRVYRGSDHRTTLVRVLAAEAL